MLYLSAFDHLDVQSGPSSVLPRIFYSRNETSIMRAITIVGNWKMNTTPSEAEQLASDIRLNVADSADATVVVCPPSVGLETVSRVLSGSEVAVGV